MAEYKYIAVDQYGNDKKGTIEATSLEIAGKLLKNKKLIVVKIGENISLLDKIKKAINFEVTYRKKYNKVLPIITKRLGFLLKNGITITNALSTLSKEFKNNKKYNKLSNVFIEIRKDVESGKALVKSFEKHTKYFPKLMIDMIEAGEISGNLSDVLLQLSEVYSKNNKLKDKIFKAMIMPTVTLIFAVLIILGMFKFLLPQMAGLYNSFNADLPKITVILMKITEVINTNFNFILIGILLFILILLSSIKKEKPRILIDTMLLKMPVLGLLQLEYNLTLFCRILSMLLKSGIEIQKALSICEKMMPNKKVKECIKQMREGVIQGKNMSSVIKDNKILPELLKSTLEIGEQTGETDNVLKELAEEYQYNIDNSSEKLTSVLSIVVTLFLGGFVGFIFLAMYLPIADLGQAISY